MRSWGWICSTWLLAAPAAPRCRSLPAATGRIHPTVGDGARAGQCLSFPPQQQQHRWPCCPTAAPPALGVGQPGHGAAGRAGARPPPSTKAGAGSGVAGARSSPARRHTSRKTYCTAATGSSHPSVPGTAVSWGQGDRGSGPCRDPPPGTWGTGLGCQRGAGGAGSGEAEARVGPALFQQKNLRCVTGAGSVTTAMSRGPGASPCHPRRAGGGRRGAQALPEPGTGCKGGFMVGAPGY